MATQYPVILAHGIILKDIKFFKAFGRIEKELKNRGYSVYTATTDGFGTIENNAEQLKEFILNVLKKENVQKVNIIAHSKGGLDAKYMIQNLDTEDCVASLTTLCSPHKGSPIASFILKFPKFIVKFIAFWINLIYKIFGDKKPDALTVCKQLKNNSITDNTLLNFSENVYCQSYSTTLKKSRDDFIMGIPLKFYKHLENSSSDGLVSTDSAKFGIYRGDCIDDSISHSQIVDFMAGKRKKEKIYSFYNNLCNDLAEMGF